MKILLDEDVHIKIVDWLQANGHDVMRVPTGLKNGRVIELAKLESRVLMTRDKDFSNRLMYPPGKSFGIIVLRIHPPQLEKLVTALQLLFDELRDATLQGKLVIVEENGYHLLS